LKEAGGRREEDNTKEDVMMNTNDLEDGDEWQPMNMKYHTFPLATVASPHRVVLMSVKSSWVRYVRKPSMLLQPDSQTILCREAFSQRSHYTEQLLHTQTSYTQKKSTRISFCTEQLLHTEAFSFNHRNFYAQTLLHRRFYTRSLHTEQLLRTEAFTHRSLYTQKFWQTDAFTHRSSYAPTLYTEATTHRNFLAHKLWHQEAFTRKAFTQTSF
jgi:hypothetical protein